MWHASPFPLLRVRAVGARHGAVLAPSGQADTGGPKPRDGRRTDFESAGASSPLRMETRGLPGRPGVPRRALPRRARHRGGAARLTSGRAQSPPAPCRPRPGLVASTLPKSTVSESPSSPARSGVPVSGPPPRPTRLADPLDSRVALERPAAAQAEHPRSASRPPIDRVGSCPAAQVRHLPVFENAVGTQDHRSRANGAHRIGRGHESPFRHGQVVPCGSRPAMSNLTLRFCRVSKQPIARTEKSQLQMSGRGPRGPPPRTRPSLVAQRAGRLPDGLGRGRSSRDAASLDDVLEPLRQLPADRDGAGCLDLRLHQTLLVL